jgi:para-nitrobenzyl esterase
LNAVLIADGKASDDATAETYIASQSDAQIADYVRSKTTGEIFKQWLTTLAKSGLAITSHIPDGNVVSSSPIAAIKAGNYLKVPILASNTREEGKLFSHFLALSPAWGGKSGFIVSDPARFDMMMKFDPNAATNLSVNDIIAPSYLPTDEPVTGYNARTGLLSQAVFYSSRDVTLNALKSKQDNVWYFMFAWNNEPAPWNEVYGAAHLLDVPFEFGNFGPSVFSRVMGGEANKAGRLALSSAMMHSIAAFAKNGDPNNASLGTSWPTWPQTLIFDATLTEKKISVK